MSRQKLTFAIKPHNKIPSDVLAVVTQVDIASKYTLRRYGTYPQAVEVAMHGSNLGRQSVSEDLARNLGEGVLTGLLSLVDGRYSLTVQGQEIVTPKSPNCSYIDKTPGERRALGKSIGKFNRGTRLAQRLNDNKGKEFWARGSI